MLSLVNSIFPEHVVRSHSISVLQIATGNLNIREKLSVGMTSVALCSAFFSFA